MQMPKCLDCGNTVRFSYYENSYNEAEYDEAGDLVDVIFKDYHPLTNQTCMECDSSHIEGEL